MILVGLPSTKELIFQKVIIERNSHLTLFTVMFGDLALSLVSQIKHGLFSALMIFPDIHGSIC